MSYYSESARFPKELTAKIPKTSLDKIVGRDGDLLDLHQRLCDRRQVVLVNGMGGIGKTTLAQVYVAHYWDEYQHVGWISQVSDNLLSDFINSEGLLDRLEITGSGQDAQELFGQIMKVLQTIADKPNLLVIDNAESTLSDIYDYLPSQPIWHILATSRQHIERFDIKKLDFLSEEEATKLFLRHYTLAKISPEEIKELVKSVDLHTLTIEILAKTAQTQRTAIHDLKQAITDDLKANVYVAHKGKKIDKVTSYLSSIFSLSGLTDDEVWLLKQFVCLPAEFHAYDKLQELINPEASTKADIFAETLAALTATGWLLKNQTTDSYKLHRIIADILKRQHPIRVIDVEGLIASVTDKLSIDQSKDNPVDKFQWIPFAQAVLALFPDSTESTIAHLQNNLALVLQDLGEYAAAKRFLEQAQHLAEQNFGDDFPTTAASYSELATMLQALGKYGELKRSIEQALRFAERKLGDDLSTKVVSCSKLANALQDLGEHEELKRLFEQALRLAERNFGDDLPTIAVSYLKLPNVLQAEYTEMLILVGKVLDLIQRILPEGHPAIKEMSDIYQSIKTTIKF